MEKTFKYKNIIQLIPLIREFKNECLKRLERAKKKTKSKERMTKNIKEVERQIYKETMTRVKFSGILTESSQKTK